ncbi:MAG: ribosome silencing factor [Betaproteobacteria bacterium HGW-Betaproteobacteria-3]|jgi:ribosome-associated protein|nr:MAG: ribosome silencing factor [Betaproteobacteria bacterium HGW-Betaproteobacteria-3]
MTSESTARKDTQKLQRAIVDGLEDVKAQDIQVFNTEHLSPLFERVIVASGTSNRQTKALAASVRDAVREAGFPKPRIEGEDNGEWIIVDCGAAVAHIMQPAIRQYYHLEELWGEKPVRLKFGAPKPVEAPAAKAPAKPAPRKSAARAAGGSESPPLRRSSAAKTAVREAEAVAREAKAASRSPRKAPARPPARAAVKAAGRSAGKVAGKVTGKVTGKVAGKAATRSVSRAPTKVVVNAPAKKVAAKAPARKSASRKA